MLGEIGCHDFHFVTKLPGLPPHENNVLNWVRSQVSRTLSDLKKEKIYGLLLHRPADLLGANGKDLVGALRIASREFGIQKLGISVYEPKELIDCWQVLHYDIVQIPCNVFDQRFTAGPIVAHLRSNNIEVHARSVFLQGLLLMPDSDRPAYFSPWANFFEAWNTLIYISERTPLEVCLAFANQQSFVHKWVIGVDSKDQLLGILSAQDSCGVEISALDWALFKDLPLELISPTCWSLQ